VSITVGVTSQSPGAVRAGMLAVPVDAERTLGAGGDAVDDALGGRLGSFMTEAGFSGKPGETLAVPAEGLAADIVLLVGVGDADQVDAATLRRAAAAVARRASKAASIATTLPSAAGSLDDAEAARAVVEGLQLGSYEFLAYKTKGEATKLRKAVLVGVGGQAVTKAINEARIITDAVRWARDIVNEPSGTKSPTEFAASAKKLLTGKGVSVKVLTEPQIKTQKMGGVLGVGQGSTRPPRFVKVTYDPPQGKVRGTLALVGKGVTFDTGGISIKPAEGMETMKTDMGGAAAVLAAMSTLRDLGVRLVINMRLTGKPKTDLHLQPISTLWLRSIDSPFFPLSIPKLRRRS
jgi:leucyl aminopeptidase